MRIFRYSLSQPSGPIDLNTLDMFDSTFRESEQSAIDDFNEKRRSLYVLIKPYEHDIINLPNELSKMIFLGCISAVESYFRKLLRSLVNIDASTKTNCEELNIKYGAVLYHDIDMMPESLLEEYSFTNGENITNSINSVVGITFDKQERELSKVLSDYSDICQLRHCIVHRFGLLGSYNAMKLGISKHKTVIEKPVKISFDQLNLMVGICDSLVKTINSFMFCEIITRTFIKKTVQWTGDYRHDKKIFIQYYKVFADSALDNSGKIVYKAFFGALSAKYGKRYTCI